MGEGDRDGWLDEWRTREQEGTKRFQSPKTTSGLGVRGSARGAEQLLQQTQQFRVFSSVLFMLMAVCVCVCVCVHVKKKMCLCDILWRV